MKQSPSYDETYELQSLADIAGREHWLNNVFLTPHWWLMLVLFIIPFIIWWRIVDRRRLFEIITYGLLVALVCEFLDAIGVETDAWDYQYKLIPLLDVLIIYDISVVPVSYMIIYQYFQTWRAFAIAHVILSLIYAYIAEPLLIWLDIYQPIAWKHIYSVPGYFFLAIILRWVMCILIKKSHKRSIL